MFHKELHWDLPYKSVHEQVMSEAQTDVSDRERHSLLGNAFQKLSHWPSTELYISVRRGENLHGKRDR